MSLQGLHDLLQRILLSLMQPVPPISRRTTTEVWTLKTDASDLGRWASLTFQGIERQAYSMSWDSPQKMWHITHREALATDLAVQNLAKHIPPGARLILKSDSTPAVWAWKRAQPTNESTTQLPGVSRHSTVGVCAPQWSTSRG